MGRKGVAHNRPGGRRRKEQGKRSRRGQAVRRREDQGPGDWIEAKRGRLQPKNLEPGCEVDQSPSNSTVPRTRRRSQRELRLHNKRSDCEQSSECPPWPQGQVSPSSAAGNLPPLQLGRWAEGSEAGVRCPRCRVSPSSPDPLRPPPAWVLQREGSG